MTDPQFARLFDAHYREFRADLPFWRGLAASSGDPILELGCGPGRVLLDLAQAGYRVTGIDNDPAMLARAAAKIPATLIDRVRLIASDLRQLSISGRYNLAIAPCNTLAYLGDHALASCLDSVAHSLMPGGTLAADLPSPSLEDLDPSSPHQDHFHEPQRGTDVQVTPQMRIDREQRRVRVIWRYDEMLPDGEVKRVEVPLTYYLRTPSEIKRQWARAGFGDFEIQGDYAGSPFSPQSKAMLVVAKRTD